MDPPSAVTAAHKASLVAPYLKAVSAFRFQCYYLFLARETDSVEAYASAWQ
jgi:hypothetical protein